MSGPRVAFKSGYRANRQMRTLSMTIPAPFVSSIMEVEKDWIDYNGHLNMA